MKHLPARPSLDYLRREARALKSSHRSCDESICSVIGHFDTSFHDLSHHDIFEQPFSILDAQRVVARQYGFASWPRIKSFVLRSLQTSAKFDQKLANRLLERYENCKELMESAKWGKDGRRQSGIVERYEQFGIETADVMNLVYDRYGWPGPDVVGAAGVEASCWLVAQATLAGSLQFRTAELMKQSLPDGNLEGRFYAIISDRCLSLTFRPTVYGLFDAPPVQDENGQAVFSHDVIDPENLDRRRATVGYPSIDVTNRDYVKDATEKGWNIYQDRGIYEKHRLDTATRGGYI